MITLFKSNETDFSHNGLGNLDYYIIDPVVEEVLNGLYKFTFKYPLFAPHGLEIEGQSILRVPVPGMEDQLFRVYRPVKSMGYISVSCYHIFYDLADNFIEDTNIVGKNGQGAIQQLGGATQFGHNFRFFSDIPNVANSRLVRKNVVASILDDEQANSFVSRWGGELIRNNFDVRMNKSAGTNRGFEVKYRKNLTGYEADVDYSTVVTRIMPKGFDGLLLPEKYVDSPLIGNYETPKIQMIEYEVKAAIGEYANDEDAIPLEDAYAELRRLANEEYSINKIDVPTVKYKVDFVTLEQTEEYKDLEGLQKLTIGDMATVDHEEDQFHVEAKLVRYQYNPISKRYLLAELGSIHGGLTTSFTKVNKISREVSELKEQTLIIQSTADGKNTIYRGESEPPNPNLGDLWYKPNGNETEMYQFLEEQGQRFWKLIADTADVTSVRNDVDQALDDAVEAKNQANEAVANANLATQNATEAIGIAQDGFNKSLEALDGLTTLREFVDDNTGEITNIKGDIQGLQTTVSGKVDNDTFSTFMQQTNNSLAGKISMTDAEGVFVKGTTFSATVEGLQTQVSNKAEQSTVTQLSNLLNSTIQSKADKSEVTQLATLVDTKVTSSQVNNLIASDKQIKDTRSTNQPPSWYFSNYPRQTVREFKQNTTMGITGEGIYSILETEVPWSGSSGGLVKQILYTDFATYERRGNGTASWQPWKKIADVDYVSSQMTVLNNAINLRVQKNDVINQINLDTTGILISGKKLILDGDTTVTGTFRVSNANITSVDAGKMTTGTLDAAKVNVINLNANNIKSGKITAVDIEGVNIYGATVEGGVLKSTDKPSWNDPNFTNRAEIKTGRMVFESNNSTLNLTGISKMEFNGFGIKLSGISDRYHDTPDNYKDNNEYILLKSTGLYAYGKSGKQSNIVIESNMTVIRQGGMFGEGLEILNASYNNDKYTAVIQSTKSGHDIAFKGVQMHGKKALKIMGINDEHAYIEFYKDGRFMTSRFGYVGNPSASSNYMAVNGMGTSLFVGKDSAGERIYSPAFYSRTSSASANVNVTSAGTLQRSTSARRYKRDIEPITEDYAYNFFNNSHPVFYRPKGTADENMSHTHYGYIADDVAPVEPRLVQFGQNGEAEGFNYDRVPTLLHVVLKNEIKRIDKHESELTILKEQNEQLVLKVAVLEQKIKKLESVA